MSAQSALLPHVVQDWLKHLERQGMSRRTVAAYRRALQSFVCWNRERLDADFDPPAIIPRDVRDLKPTSARSRS